MGFNETAVLVLVVLCGAILTSAIGAAGALIFSLADDAGWGSKQRTGRGSARRRRNEYRKINC